MVYSDGRLFLMDFRSTRQSRGERPPSVLSSSSQVTVTWMEFLLKLSSILKSTSVFAALSCSFAASARRRDSWGLKRLSVER